MNPLTTRERRGMTAISTAACRMLIVAADQRNSMKAVMTDGPGAVSDAELAAAKSDLVRYLANNAPAILLDPEIALPAVVDDGTLARGTALVVGMDASGYETVDGLRTPGSSRASPRAGRGSWVATSRRCCSTSAPTARAPTPFSPSRCASSSATAPRRGSCSSSSC